VINQFDLADKGYTFAGFLRSSDGEADKREIESRLEHRGLFARRLKVELFPGLAKKEFHIIRVPLKGKQAQLYERARRALELELRGFDYIAFRRQLASYFQRRAALLQICATPQAIDPTSQPSEKLPYLDELMKQLIGAGRKVVLWSFYTSSIDELTKRYERYNPVRIDGTVSQAARSEAIAEFQDGTRAMLFIGNPAAAGAGITLHSSYDCIYYSFSNQAAHYLQSLDRVHRRGQKAPVVNYYFIVCKDTIEESEVQRLRRKELSQHALLGDNIVFPSSIDEALSELQHGPSSER
jgi:SNF2 family DNA or RNA helicase